MQYIVLDLEWNQPEYYAKMVIDPVPLHGEIIQIGAVKLDEQLQRLDTFKIFVRPVRYRKMHKKVARITGLSETDFEYGFPFQKAFSLFRKWCCEDFVYFTWGNDDESVLRSNLELYKMNTDWLPCFYDIQLIFGAQIGRAGEQIALSRALEMLQETPHEFHDALQDAMNTVLVCRHLDIKSAIENYPQLLPASNKGNGACASAGEFRSVGYPTKQHVLAAEEVCTFQCPSCGKSILCEQWEKQKTDRYMCISECPDCGKYFARLRIKQRGDGLYKASRSIVALTDELLDDYFNAISERERKKAEWDAQHPV